jgi:ankyrin repeat protein
MDTFDLLIKAGADPMLSDSDGNTILHLMALGVIRDAEYDFIKQIIEKYSMRLTRNRENKTPLNIIRSNSGKPIALRGQPNYKKKLWEYFELKIKDDPSFQDSEKNESIHEAVIRGDLDEVKKVLDKHDLKDGKSLPKLY